MSGTGCSQYYQNTLQPVKIDKSTLLQVLKQLQSDVIYGTQVIQKSGLPDLAYYGSIYNGTPGITLTFLRLARQTTSLAGEHQTTLPDFRRLATERITTGPESTPPNLQPGRMSPLGSSSLGAILVRILAACEFKEIGGAASRISEDDITALEEGVQLALGHGHVITFRGHRMGGDEALYGRAGLLWAILNIRSHTLNCGPRAALDPLFRCVPKLVDLIIDAGRQGSRDFAKEHGDKDAFPLMWLWLEDHYGLGAIHGIAGILMILLECGIDELDNGGSRKYLPWIVETITGLSRICIFYNGHLPTSIPPRASSRPSHLVQICHGSPGLLLLLASARRNSHLTAHYWQPEWDEAIRLCTERVWEEGLLSKGGNLCHGLTGNAWPLLMLHDCFEYDVDDMERAKRAFMERAHFTAKSSSPAGLEVELSGDYFLSRGLAFLLLARESPPYSTALEIESSYHFHMPDNPYSLFEGLAGILCAWTEACAVIKSRLRKMEMEMEEGRISSSELNDDSIFRECMLQQLGFPGLGGCGPRGLL